MVSPAFSGPIVRMVTGAASGPPLASWIRSASSTAYSSSSFMTASAESRSSVLSVGLSFFSAQESGTCFTQTTMFIRASDLPLVGRPRARPLKCVSGPPRSRNRGSHVDPGDVTGQ